MKKAKLINKAIIGQVLSGLAVATMASSAFAATWSDTSIGWRTGSSFREPVNSEKISKNIFNFTHVSGYKYGNNFLNIDLLQSNAKDPSGVGATSGAHEAYLVYRHTLDIGKVLDTDIKFAGVRGLGLTAGYDWNAKTDAGYNSKKRMLVVGPTLMMNVPGFLNVGLYGLWESNAPCNSSSGSCINRYNYDPHLMLNLAWGIPAGVDNLKFEGFANFIQEKGKDEFGGQTKAETNIDMALMYDLGSALGAKGLRAGIGYQYWKNKFGNDNGNAYYRDGAFAKTPMLRADYHF